MDVSTSVSANWSCLHLSEPSTPHWVTSTSLIRLHLVNPSPPYQAISTSHLLDCLHLVESSLPWESASMHVKQLPSRARHLLAIINGLNILTWGGNVFHDDSQGDEASLLWLSKKLYKKFWRTWIIRISWKISFKFTSSLSRGRESTQDTWPHSRYEKPLRNLKDQASTELDGSPRVSWLFMLHSITLMLLSVLDILCILLSKK